MQILQAWKEHQRLKKVLPLPRIALNRKFFEAALARIKNAANGLYATCEVHLASRVDVAAKNIDALFRPCTGGWPQILRSARRALTRRTCICFTSFGCLAFFCNCCKEYASTQRPYGRPNRCMHSHFLLILLGCIFLSTLTLIDLNMYELAFVLSMVPIASAGMNLMRPWPGLCQTTPSKLAACFNFEYFVCSSVSSSRNRYQCRQSLLQI